MDGLKAIPHKDGLKILKDELFEKIQKFSLIDDKDVAYYEAKIHMTYFDSDGILTIICIVPKDEHFTSWNAYVRILTDDNIIIANIETPAIMFVKGVGGEQIVKITVSGEAGTIAFRADEYMTHTEVNELVYNPLKLDLKKKASLVYTNDTYLQKTTLNNIVHGDNATRTTTIKDCNNPLPSGFYDGDKVIGAMEENWRHYIITRHVNNSFNYQLQISSSFWNDDISFRRIQNNVPKRWLKLWHEGNLNLEDLGAPLATIITFPVGIPPSGYIECNGSILSRTTYKKLFDVIGTKYGTGDGSTTFRLPDLRGMFVRGWSNGASPDRGRVIGSYQEDLVKNHNHTVGGSNSFAGLAGYKQGTIDRGDGTHKTGAELYSMDLSGGGNETRPRNVAMMYCIKY